MHVPLNFAKGGENAKKIRTKIENCMILSPKLDQRFAPLLPRNTDKSHIALIRQID